MGETNEGRGTEQGEAEQGVGITPEYAPVIQQGSLTPDAGNIDLKKCFHTGIHFQASELTVCVCLWNLCS